MLIAIFLLATESVQRSTSQPVRAITIHEGDDSLDREAFLKRAERVFGHLNSFYHGRLDEETFRNAFQSPRSRRGKVRVPFVRYDAPFEAIDANNDRHLTRDEYLVFAGKIFDIISRGRNLVSLRDPVTLLSLQKATQ